MRSDFLRTTEAAVAAGVALRDVNRVIDEGILPETSVSAEDGRQVSTAACLYIAFYFESADQLTAKERKFFIRAANSQLRRWTTSLTYTSGENCVVRHNFVAVDFAPIAKAVSERLDRLDAANKMVVSSPDLLSGTPVVRGTRIPVHDIAASVEAGLSKARLLAAYPALDEEKIDLAVMYAKANPSKGRPRSSREVPPGAVVRTDRRGPRRKSHE